HHHHLRQAHHQDRPVQGLPRRGHGARRDRAGRAAAGRRRRRRAGRGAGADRARCRARHAGHGAGRAGRGRLRRSGHRHLVGDVPAPDRRLGGGRPGRRAHHLALRRGRARRGRAAGRGRARRLRRGRPARLRGHGAAARGGLPPRAGPARASPPHHRPRPGEVMTLVVPLRSVGRGDLALAGGKGANLGELIAGGFPVPAGFVVTTAAYDLVAAGQVTRAHFEGVAVPGPLRRAILDAYRELGGGPVAVRSSATAEDLPGAAFAGQQDTFLNVVGEDELIDAVRRCWGSLWSERAVAYRDRLGIDRADVRIAVVVQRMVAAEAAGVLFTADPVTGVRGRLVADAGTGLGEAVVSGLVTPDHYVLTPQGEVVSYTPGRREVVVRAVAGGGVSHERGDGAPAGRLPGAALRELARLGTEAARHFGRPQDIEWTYAGGEVSLVQARPMTALPPPPIGRLGPLRRKLATVLMEYVPVR